MNSSTEHALVSSLVIGVAWGVLLIYLPTVAPTITWDNGGTDSGELAAAVASLGIPHPPGYPTYVLLGRTWLNLPLGGDVAYRLNLFSMVGTALAAGLSAAAIYILGRHLEFGPAAMAAGAITGSLSLALAPLTWSQATITEIYGPGLAALSLLTLLAMAWRFRMGPGRLVLLGLVAGLGLGITPQLLLALPGLSGLLYFTPKDNAISKNRVSNQVAGKASFPNYPTDLLFVGIGIGIGLLTFIYLPWRARAQPMFNWGNPSSSAQFWWVVSAAQYHHLANLTSMSQLGNRLAAGALFSVQQAGWATSILALAGGQRLWRTHKAVVGYLLTLMGLTLLFQAGYPVLHSSVYLLPVIFGLALLAGVGATRLLVACQINTGRAGAILLGLILWAGLAGRAIHTAPLVDVSHSLAAARFGQQTLAKLAPGALLVSDNDQTTFSLWYWQALGHRPDVVIVDSRLLFYPWYQQHLKQQYPDLNPASVRPGGLTALNRPIYSLVYPPDQAPYTVNKK